MADRLAWDELDECNDGHADRHAGSRAEVGCGSMLMGTLRGLAPADRQEAGVQAEYAADAAADDVGFERTP
jgi:hypothetical protein